MKKFELWYPIKPFNVTQVFGVNGEYYQKNGINVAGHNGIDLQAYHGQPVYAAHDGTCYTEVDSGGGNGVVIRTDEEFEYEGKPVHMKTIYWHLTDADAVVKTGQKVKTGDLIGYADSTGFSTGDHLHFGLKPQAWNEKDWAFYNVEQNNGYAGSIDPTPYFNKYYATDSVKVLGIMQQIVDTLKALLTLGK